MCVCLSSLFVSFLFLFLFLSVRFCLFPLFRFVLSSLLFLFHRLTKKMGEIDALRFVALRLFYKTGFLFSICIIIELCNYVIFLLLKVPS